MGLTGGLQLLTVSCFSMQGYPTLSPLFFPLFATLWTVAHQAPLSMGILQARILEWVAMLFSRGSSQPRDRTLVSCGSCLAGRFSTTEPPGKPLFMCIPSQNKHKDHSSIKKKGLMKSRDPPSRTMKKHHIFNLNAGGSQGLLRSSVGGTHLGCHS